MYIYIYIPKLGRPQAATRRRDEERQLEGPHVALAVENPAVALARRRTGNSRVVPDYLVRQQDEQLPTCSLDNALAHQFKNYEFTVQQDWAHGLGQMY